ncbi:MAG: PTS sugar transporter subunit IIA [Candidatus Cloacimonetes bacterium]|nr:PTS sugar transporter subunit IIA [Candidatus Cloacimonadota bacterium]
MGVFSLDLIKINYYALDKKSLLTEMVEFVVEKKIVEDEKSFLTAVLDRENLMSTGIGKNVAIPHARGNFVKELKIAVYLLDNELDYNSIDGKMVKMVFLICVPDTLKNRYMEVLSAISNFLREDKKRENLLNSKSVSEIYEILKGIEI